MELREVATQRYDIGRCAIFLFGTLVDGVIVPDVWEEDTPLFEDASMHHIGNTEGAVDIEPNTEYSELTLPETSGPAAIKRYLTGDRPQFELGVFPNPELIKVFSPTGRGSAGQQRRRRVQEGTLWIVPEELFLAPDANGNMVEVPVTYNGSAFLKDGDALTDEEQELMDMSMLCWRTDYSRLAPIFRHEDGGKALKQVTVMMQQDFTKPDGCQIYLMMGEAVGFGINFMGS